ncbi:MAG: hypothetical protein JEZ12_02075 [Desulfobacterium sp.]|nr:hypothetical protein [Desulfobacterium sp.]
MTINSVSGSNHYSQTQNLEATRPAPPPVKEQPPDPSTNQRDSDLSSQAFQVSITDQGREALRAEQASQEPPLASESPPPSNQAPGQDQGTTRIVDLVA